MALLLSRIPKALNIEFARGWGNLSYGFLEKSVYISLTYLRSFFNVLTFLFVFFIGVEFFFVFLVSSILDHPEVFQLFNQDSVVF